VAQNIIYSYGNKNWIKAVDGFWKGGSAERASDMGDRLDGHFSQVTRRSDFN
jgi:hypothetical protein